MLYENNRKYFFYAVSTHDENTQDESAIDEERVYTSKEGTRGVLAHLAHFL